MGRQLRHLCLQMVFVNICPVCLRHARRIHLNAHTRITWRMDLNCLEKYGLNLDSFELQVQDVDTEVAHDGYFHITNQWAKVESCFEKEMRRVGEVLTGDCYGAFLTYRPQQSTVLFRYERHRQSGAVSSTTSQLQRSARPVQSIYDNLEVR